MYFKLYCIIKINILLIISAEGVVFMKLNLSLQSLVTAGIAFLIFSVVVMVVIYVIYFTELKEIIPPEHVSSTMEVLISTAGLFIAILAFIAYIKLEGEFRNRKITEENINKEIKRKEFLSTIKNFELLIEQFYEGIVPNAINLNRIEILTKFLNKRLSEIDDLMMEFIKVCGHLRNIEEDNSKYAAKKVKIKDFNKLDEVNKIKILRNLVRENNFNNIEIEDSSFTSDEILRKINDLRYNIFLIKSFSNYLELGSQKISTNQLLNTSTYREIDKLFRNTYYKSLLLYLMVGKNIIVE